MKAILISDHAIWCALMMNGKKKVEVRKGTALYKATKKLIDEYGYAEFYVYCTKEKAARKEDMFTRGCNIWFNKGYAMNRQYLINGKVPFKFHCYKVEEIKFIMDYIYGGYYNTNSYTNEKCFERDCCLTVKELDNYINKNNLNKRDNVAYALHISNLVIFDRPRELCEFHTNIKKEPPEELLCPECGKPMEYYEYKYLTKPPQSWCYVEVE